ncbi:MAG: HEAT repeat domain-containing protein [Leptolyngbyaceae cyanobacterium SM1_1_3]|nr:HEAT repeat domain-containing protein [Leptolyngbyaceae cyanobacterium SM1_1_3]NJN04776.1 HEAT repeat domain-containing protein [Leptolyngbyaceae cyanobacterium RM1_1_2]NJO11883.1 HEAT repeat domain-containing protein [Leptolyngbyaceae cyanobacterium SL_1_1]
MQPEQIGTYAAAFKDPHNWTAVLLKRLNNQERQVRYRAVHSTVFTLGNLGVASEAVISALLNCLQDKKESLRSIATLALGKLRNNFGESSSPCFQQITQWLEQNHDADYVAYGVNVLWEWDMSR